MQTKFVIRREYSIGMRLVEGYLHQPYTWFLERNSADLGKNVLSEVAQVIKLAIGPIANVIAHGFVAFTILGVLFYIIITYITKTIPTELFSKKNL